MLAPAERLTFGEVADRNLHHLEHVAGRKRATTQDYRIISVGTSRRASAGRRSNESGHRTSRACILAVRAAGLELNTVTNHLNFAHGVDGFAVKSGWAPSNPVDAVDRARAPRTDPDIRYLDREELEMLLRAAARDDVLGPTEVAAVEPGPAPAGPHGRRARSPLPMLVLPGRRRTRLLPSAERRSV